MDNQTKLINQLIKEEVKRSLIHEGLIYSYPPSFIFQKLKEIGFLGTSFTKNKVFIINFELGDGSIKKYEKLNHFMDVVCGWKHSLTLVGD